MKLYEQGMSQSFTVYFLIFYSPWVFVSTAMCPTMYIVLYQTVIRMR